MKYVLGFLFASDGGHVALIVKSHPPAQAGCFNGIGGKPMPGEKPLDTMRREFAEETGVTVEDWAWRLNFGDQPMTEQSLWQVDVFRSFVPADAVNLPVLRRERGSGEFPVWVRTDEAATAAGAGTRCWSNVLNDSFPVLYNLSWLIPLVLDSQVAGSCAAYVKGQT